MDEIIREQQFSGRVIGIRASYSPRIDPADGRASGEPLAERQRRRSHRDDLHPGAQGHRHRRRRARRQSAVPQHVLSGVEGARFRVERLGAAGTPRSGRERHHRRHESRREPRGHAAEPLLRQHVPLPGNPCDARSVHRHASGSPDVLVPRIDGLQPRHRLLPAPDRREPGREAVLQRASDHETGGRRRVSGRAVKGQPKRGSTMCSSIGATPASRTSGRPTQSPTASMPRWR